MRRTRSISNGLWTFNSIEDDLSPFPVPLRKVFASVGEDEWTRYRRSHPDAFAGDDIWAGRVSCLLAQGPQGTVLVDTGIGAATRAFPQMLGKSGRLMEELDALEINPKDISLVIVTHLHPDHVGWNIDPESGEAAFTNARYLVPTLDWADLASHSGEPGPLTAFWSENVLPLRDTGRLELVDLTERQFEGMALRPAVGHTPGHMAVVFDGERQLWALGDAFVHPLQLETPSHSYMHDFTHEVAAKTRIRLLGEIPHDAIVTACHFPLDFYERSDGGGEHYWSPMGGGHAV